VAGGAPQDLRAPPQHRLYPSILQQCELHNRSLQSLHIMTEIKHPRRILALGAPESGVVHLLKGISRCIVIRSDISNPRTQKSLVPHPPSRPTPQLVYRTAGIFPHGTILLISQSGSTKSTLSLSGALNLQNLRRKKSSPSSELGYTVSENR